MANDQYNSYRNDVIDGYEKERKTEHRGTMLGDAYDNNGHFNKNILITRMELANGLTFKDSISSSKFTTDGFFDNYGEEDVNTNKPRAIRVWSGNDHWLLTKDSADDYLKILPLGVTVKSTTMFNLIYWTESELKLKELIDNKTFDTSAYALLYHNGTAGEAERGATVIQHSKELEDGETVEKKAPAVKIKTDGESISNESNDDTIIIPQSWDQFSAVYLKSAPIHSKYALGTDDLKLPLYGGVLGIVFKDGTEFEISTYTKLSYFYTLKELREYAMPDVTNASIPFDWDKTGGHNVRHVPLVVVNPNDPTKRMRVLDSFDSNITHQERDEYSIVIGSSTIFEPTLKDGFKLLSYPDNLNISFSDSELSIKGLKVAKVVPGTETVYYSAEQGTLYLKDNKIADHEMCLNNLGNKITRTVYGKALDSEDEFEVMDISYPVVEPTAAEVLATSGVSIPDTKVDETTKEPTEEEVGQTMAKAQASLGCNDPDTVAENSIFYVQRRSIVTNGILPRRFASSLLRITKIGQSVLDKIGTVTNRKTFNTAATGLNFIRKGFLNPMVKGFPSYMNQSKVMMRSAYVPPLIQTTREEIKKNPSNFLPWGAILKAGVRFLPGIISGVSGLFRSKKNVVIVKPRRTNLTKYGADDVSEQPIFAYETTWETKKVCPLCEDAVVTGVDPDSTASTMAIKVQTMGQQQLVTLHHPQAVTENGLIALRMVKPPTNEAILYGTENPTEALKGAEFVAVNSKNEDVPLTGRNTLNGSPYLSVENGGIICRKINWSPSVANGQVDVEVQASQTAIERYLAMNCIISDHLKTTNNPNGILSGALSLFNRARRFASEHPKITALAKRGLAWGASAIWNKVNPVNNTNGNPDSEADVVVQAPTNLAVEDPESVDQDVDDTVRSSCVAISFDGNFPIKKGITIESIQEFFNKAQVAILNENDEEYKGTVGLGLDRNYLAPADYEIPASLAKDLMEFGKSEFSWSGISFEIKQGFVNCHTKPDYKLKMTSPPTKKLYSFGEKEVDLNGATWDLVDSSDKIIIEGLTSDNVLCEPLPTNIEEMVLEEPEKEEDKTQINVYFLGFKNTEIRVSLIAPFVLALKQYTKTNEVDASVGFALLSLAKFLAPVAINLVSKIFGKKGGENATVWPKTHPELLKALDCKIVLRDNFMRRKVFLVENMSDELIKKIFQVGKEYNPDSTEDVQEITIKCMNYTTKKFITRESIKYISEDEMTKGQKITEDQVHDNPPADWDGSTPETSGGMTASLQEETTSEMIQHIRRKYDLMRRNGKIQKHPYYMNPNGLIGKLFRTGFSLISGLFAKTQNLNELMTQSTGLRHHGVGGIKSFFKKLWRGIKKGAKKVWKGVKTVVSKVVSVGKNIIGNVIAGALGGGASEEEPQPQSGPRVGCYYVHDGTYGENGVLNLKPLIMKNPISNAILSTDIPWRGIRAFPYTTSGGSRRLCYGFSSLRRHVGGYVHRNPSFSPGMGLHILGRRYPDVFPSHFAGIGNEYKTGGVSNEDVFFDTVELVGVSTYDEEMIIYSDSSSLTDMAFYSSSIAFSCQDLCLGDTWPTVEEIIKILYVYAQRKDSKDPYKWVAIPLSHPTVKVDNYSNIDDATEQMVTITITLPNDDPHITKCLLYRNASKLTPVSQSDHGYVSFVQHPFIDTSCIAYLFEKRSDTQKLEDGSFVNTNGKEADVQKLITYQNRKVESVLSTEEDSASTTWKDDTTLKIVTGTYNFVGLDRSDVIQREIYRFKYADVPAADYMEIIEYESENETYITKDDILLQYDTDSGSLKVIGYKKDTDKNTATLKKYCKVVEHFTA